jgi:hypothetical protein
LVGYTHKDEVILKGCDFVIWKKIAGKNISSKMATNLLKFRKSGPFKGFISKKKKDFLPHSRFIRMKERGKYHLILMILKNLKSNRKPEKPLFKHK